MNSVTAVMYDSNGFRTYKRMSKILAEYWKLEIMPANQNCVICVKHPKLGKRYVGGDTMATITYIESIDKARRFTKEDADATVAIISVVDKFEYKVMPIDINDTRPTTPNDVIKAIEEKIGLKQLVIKKISRTTNGWGISYAYSKNVVPGKRIYNDTMVVYTYPDIEKCLNGEYDRIVLEIKSKGSVTLKPIES